MGRRMVLLLQQELGRRSIMRIRASAFSSSSSMQSLHACSSSPSASLSLPTLPPSRSFPVVSSFTPNLPPAAARRHPSALRRPPPTTHYTARHTIHSRTYRTLAATTSSQHSSRANFRRPWLLLALIPLGLAPIIRLDDPSSASQRDPSLEHGKEQGKEQGQGQEEERYLDDDDDDELDEQGRGPGFFRRIWLLLNRYVFEPIGTTRRFLYLAILFLPVILTAPILALELVERRQPPSARLSGTGRFGERATTRWWYRFLVKQMERAGPTFIKLAQWAGSRRDLFPDQLCEMFGRLHSNGKPHSLKYTKRVLEKAFGKPFDEIFLEFDEKPMGIGAIAQAYKAVLNPDLVPNSYRSPKHQASKTILPLPSSPDRAKETAPSTVVAIKVLHPHVEKVITRDLKIMGFFARLINLFPGMEWLSFPQEVEVFGEMMKSQLNLTTESKNLLRFEHNFKHRTVVSFPRPLVPYTSKRVLVEEYEDAVPLKAFLREGGGPYDYRIASLGLDAFLNMLLIDNFVHADLHPGNIMVKFYKPSTKSILQSLWARVFDNPEPDQATQQGSAKSDEIAQRLRSVAHDHSAWLDELQSLEDQGYQPEIVLLDTGLVTELDGENRKNFIDLFRAVAEFDGYKAGRLMVERCKSPELVTDPETFALKMQHLVLSVKSKTFSLAQIKISDILSEVLQNVRLHHVRLEGDFINTVISILLLEGIGRQLDPDMDLFKGALPILRQLGRQMGSSETLKETVSSGSLGPMLKIWIWMEARELTSLAVREVDDMIRFDALTSSV